MSKIIQRIQQFAEYQYDSIREFERESGVTQGVFAKSFKNQSEIRTDSVESFAQRFPEVSAEWLLRGEGEMLKKESSSESVAIKVLADKIAEQAEEIARLKALLNVKGGTAESADPSLCADAS